MKPERLAELRYGGLDWEELLHIGDVNEAEETDVLSVRLREERRGQRQAFCLLPRRQALSGSAGVLPVYLVVRRAVKANSISKSFKQPDGAFIMR